MGDAPHYLTTLIERFDADAFDAPSGRARIRLTVGGEESWDVLVKGREARLRPPDEAHPPDATLNADAGTWRKIGADLRGGMAAYSAGRLRIKQNLHLGVGLLAATSGNTDP